MSTEFSPPPKERFPVHESVTRADEDVYDDDDAWDTSHAEDAPEDAAATMRSAAATRSRLLTEANEAIRLLTRYADVFAASWSGDDAAVSMWLRADASLARAVDDSEWGEGYSALHYAAYAGHVDVCATLLDAGAAVNKRNDSGCTPLYLASQQGCADALKLLLNADADVAFTDSVEGAEYTAADVAANGEIRAILIGMTGCVAPRELSGPAVSAAAGLKKKLPVICVDWTAERMSDDLDAPGDEDDGLVLATTSFTLEIVQRLAKKGEGEGSSEAVRRLALANISRSKALNNAPEEASYGSAARLTLKLRRADVNVLRRNLGAGVRGAINATLSARVRANNGVGGGAWSAWSLPCTFPLPEEELRHALPHSQLKLACLSPDTVELHWQLPSSGDAAALLSNASALSPSASNSSAKPSHSASSALRASSSTSTRIERRRAELRLRRRLYQFFLRRDPGEVRRVDEFVARSVHSTRTREKLFESLCDRYGVPEVPQLPTLPRPFENKKIYESFAAEGMANEFRSLLGPEAIILAASASAASKTTDGHSWDDEKTADALLDDEAGAASANYIVQLQSCARNQESSSGNAVSEARKNKHGKGRAAPNGWTLSRTRGVVGHRSFESSAAEEGLAEAAWCDAMPLLMSNVEIVLADTYDSDSSAPTVVRFVVRTLQPNTLYFFRIVEANAAEGVARRASPAVRAVTAMPFSLPSIMPTKKAKKKAKKKKKKTKKAALEKRPLTAEKLPAVPSASAPPRVEPGADSALDHPAVIDIEDEERALVEPTKKKLQFRLEPPPALAKELASTADAFRTMMRSKKAAAASSPFAKAARAFEAMVTSQKAASPMRGARKSKEESKEESTAAAAEKCESEAAVPTPTSASTLTAALEEAAVLEPEAEPEAESEAEVLDDAQRVGASPLVQLSDVYRRTVQGIVSRRNDAAPAGARAVPKGKESEAPMRDALSNTFRRQAAAASSSRR